MNENKFRIRFCSDLDYEEMVVDIIWNNQTVATISQEKGIENMQLKIFASSEENRSWVFSLDDFIDIISVAKKKFIDFRNLNE
jgi:hypothetical protein